MVKQEIAVVRYGHRDVRDYRVTSHCALVARAFGAKKMIVCGNKDEASENTIKQVNQKWGGNFLIEYNESWRNAVTRLKNEGYCIAHLTMYGELLSKKEAALSRRKRIAVIIGSQKVEKAVYEEADYNISVTSQPHSEIAALAVFLDRVQKGKELSARFENARLSIIPQKKGKKMAAGNNYPRKS